MYSECLGQTGAKVHTLFRTEITKIIPCSAAHPCLGNKRSTPRDWSDDQPVEILH